MAAPILASTGLTWQRLGLAAWGNKQKWWW